MVVGKVIVVLGLVAVCARAAHQGGVEQDTNQSLDGLPDNHPYGNVLNNDGGDLQVYYPTPTPVAPSEPDQPSDAPPAPASDEEVLSCVEAPGGHMGVSIECPSICEEVCAHRSDCPCNDNGKANTCWVPKAKAKQLCRNLTDCTIISSFTGSASSGLAFYQDWVHLGRKPLVPVPNFKASVCDRSFEDARSGCYGCQGECSEAQRSSDACRQCFASSHNPAYHSPDKGYCEAFDGSDRPSPCAECGCCSFVSQGICDYHGDTCEPPARQCTAEVVDGLRSVAPSCGAWLSKVLSGYFPSLPGTCQCINDFFNDLEESPVPFTTDMLDCAVVPRTHSILHLNATCAVRAPCSAGDQCEGCKTYGVGPPLAAPNTTHWVPLRSVNTPVVKQCGFHPLEHRCVVRDTNGVLMPREICSARNASVTYGIKDWWWTSRKRDVVLSPPTQPPSPPPPRALYDSSADAPGIAPPWVPGERRSPKKSNKVAPSPEPLPTPPTETAVNTSRTSLGNAAEHREFVDKAGELSIAMACDHMAKDGVVTAWELYAAREGVVHAQVLREIGTPPDMERNNYTVRAFNVVGENILHVDSLGKHTFEIDRCHRIKFEEGDVIGFYTEGDRGVLSFSSGGAVVLYRYGSPDTPTLAALSRGPGHRVYATNASMVFVGDGIARSYSLSAVAALGDAVKDLEDAEKGLSACSVVLSPSPSPSAHPSPSPAPSVVVGSACGLGRAYYCSDIERMAECRINRTEWIHACGFKESAARIDPVPLSNLPIRVNKDAAWNVLLNGNDVFQGKCGYCMGGQEWDGMCATGKHQSPIAFEWDKVSTDDKPLQYFHGMYTPTNTTLSHNSYALTLRGNFGTLMADGQLYDAGIVLLRAPAEHVVEGQPRSPVEAQIVHKHQHSDATLIVSVLFDRASSSGAPPHPLSAVLMPPLPSSPTQTRALAELDLGQVVDDSKVNAWYSGSITVPPCTEGVTWVVQMGDNPTLTDDAIDAVNGLFKNNDDFAKGRGNNRVRQLLNDRTPRLRANCGFTGTGACPRDEE